MQSFIGAINHPPYPDPLLIRLNLIIFHKNVMLYNDYNTSGVTSPLQIRHQRLYQEIQILNEVCSSEAWVKPNIHLICMV